MSTSSYPDIAELEAQNDVPGLISLLGDMNENRCAAVVEALGNVGDPRAIQPLIGKMNDTYSVVYKIRQVLKKFGPQVVDPLIPCLADEKVFAVAMDVINDFVRPYHADTFLTMLQDEHKTVRIAAAKYLGKLREPRAVEPLIKALNDPESYVRIEAVGALGSLNDRRAVEPIIALLPMLPAIGALGRLGDVRAVQPLAAILKTGEENQRWVAADALGMIQDNSVIEPLLAALKDASVRRRAALSLVSLYKNDRIDSAHKQMILACKKDITQPHTDSHIDKTCDIPRDEHTDLAAVEFPL